MLKKKQNNKPNRWNYVKETLALNHENMLIL